MGDLAKEQLEEGVQAVGEAVEHTTGLFEKLLNQFTNYLPTAIIALAVFLIGMLLSRLLMKILGHALGKSKMNETAKSFSRSLVRILCVTLLLIICLSILGVPMASIITVIGAAGVTVGLALQNALSNLSGGFIIMLSKPFQAGDYIIAGGKEGFVESVTILHTQLRTRDHRCIYLPNSIVSAGAVENLTQKGELRLAVPVTVSYRADIKAARDVLLKAVNATEHILKKPEAAVSVKELGDHGVVLCIYCWVKPEHCMTAEAAVREAAKYALDAAGIEIPYPQLVLHRQGEPS